MVINFFSCEKDNEKDLVKFYQCDLEINNIKEFFTEKLGYSYYSDGKHIYEDNNFRKITLGVLENGGLLDDFKEYTEELKSDTRKVFIYDENMKPIDNFTMGNVSLYISPVQDYIILGSLNNEKKASIVYCDFKNLGSLNGKKMPREYAYGEDAKLFG